MTPMLPPLISYLLTSQMLDFLMKISGLCQTPFPWSSSSILLTRRSLTRTFVKLSKTQRRGPKQVCWCLFLVSQPIAIMYSKGIVSWSQNITIYSPSFRAWWHLRSGAGDLNHWLKFEQGPHPCSNWLSRRIQCNCRGACCLATSVHNCGLPVCLIKDCLALIFFFWYKINFLPQRN